MTNSRKLVNFIIVLIIPKNISEIARKASKSQKKRSGLFSKISKFAKIDSANFSKITNSRKLILRNVIPRKLIP